MPRKPNPASKVQRTPTAHRSALLDTRIIYCGDCPERLRQLPDGCVDLIYIDPPESSNRNYEVLGRDQGEAGLRGLPRQHAGVHHFIRS